MRDFDAQEGAGLSPGTMRRARGEEGNPREIQNVLSESHWSLSLVMGIIIAQNMGARKTAFTIAANTMTEMAVGDS